MDGDKRFLINSTGLGFKSKPNANSQSKTHRQNLKWVLLLLALAACSGQAQEIPAPYRGAAPPSVDFLTDAANLAAGHALYQRHCATCHGESGRGDGLAGHTLALKPANLTDPRGVAQKPLDYWFWRVSEGGTAEPFHRQGSIMPAWKHHLSETERWQVIAFARRLGAEVK